MLSRSLSCRAADALADADTLPGRRCPRHRRRPAGQAIPSAPPTPCRGGDALAIADASR
ncbi:MAG: hypothetical protein LBR05_01300 [Azoarcus sp.]|nr:hypothetical protein [Azoarcus sp.]